MTCQIFLLALQKDTLAAAKLYDDIGHLYIYFCDPAIPPKISFFRGIVFIERHLIFLYRRIIVMVIDNKTTVVMQVTHFLFSIN